MLGHDDDARETAFERVEARPDLHAQAVLLQLHFENVLRPADAVGQLLRLAAYAVVDVGQHFGDRPRGIGMLDAVRTQEFDPCEGRIRTLHLPVGGVLAYIIRHEPFHQAVAVDRQHLPRQTCRPAVEPCGGIACQVALRPEQQRVGRSRKTFVHAPAEYPHVGQRHVGNTLHGGRNPGPRGTYLPPHGCHTRRDVGRRSGDRVGRTRHLRGHVVIETARHGADIHLLLRQRIPRRHGHLQQRTPRERQHGEQGCRSHAKRISVHFHTRPPRNYRSILRSISRI